VDGPTTYYNIVSGLVGVASIVYCTSALIGTVRQVFLHSAQLAAREPTVLVRYSRQQELKCIASRPYEALSAILKYENSPIKGASSGLGKVQSANLPTPLKRRDSLVTLHQGAEPNVVWNVYPTAYGNDILVIGIASVSIVYL
jgi:hypothetical protein